MIIQLQVFVAYLDQSGSVWNMRQQWGCLLQANGRDIHAYAQAGLKMSANSNNLSVPAPKLPLGKGPVPDDTLGPFSKAPPAPAPISTGSLTSPQIAQLVEVWDFLHFFSSILGSHGLR